MLSGYPGYRRPNRGYGADISTGNAKPITVVLDVDGTLVDTNYQHAIAWHRALRDHGHTVQLWEIHRHIGMGGDQLVEALIGADGEAIREAEGEAYGELTDEVQAMDGASDLLGEPHEDGATVVLASSAKAEEVDRNLDLLGARELVDGWTSAADVERTKPEPDLIQVALQSIGELRKDRHALVEVARPRASAPP